MHTTLSHDDDLPLAMFPPDTSYFDLSAEDLLDMKDFFEQDEEPLPTDLMVALIDKGIIFNAPFHT